MATSRKSPRPRRLKSARPAVPTKSAAKPVKTPRGAELVALEKLALSALADMKAVNIKVLDVRGLTDIADTMIVASGTSDRHVKAIAENVVVKAKAAGRRPMGTEGRQDGEWVLVDMQDVLVHVMLPRVREFYALEELWEAPYKSKSKSAAKAVPRGAAAKSRARRAQ